MKRKAKFKSEVFEAIHSAAQGLHRAGVNGGGNPRDSGVLMRRGMIAGGVWIWFLSLDFSIGFAGGVGGRAPHTGRTAGFETWG